MEDLVEQFEKLEIMVTTYIVVSCDWLEANGDHVLKIDALHVPIDNPNNLRVIVTQEKIIEVESIVPKSFHNGERLE